MKINLDIVPHNIDKAVEILLEAMDIDDLKYCIEHGAHSLHMTTGMWIRNNWGLWHGSPLQDVFLNVGIWHADDMSGIILDRVDAEIRNKRFSLPDRIQYYKDYWVNQGLNNDEEVKRVREYVAKNN